MFERLGNLFKSFVNDIFDDDSSKDNKTYDRTYVDPDEQAAWDELNDYLKDEESGSSKQHSSSGSQSHTNSQSGSYNSADSTLKEDFKTLEVPFGASYDDVKKSYKNLLRQYHPDKHANDPAKLKYATEITQKLNQSFLRIKKHYKKK